MSAGGISPRHFAVAEQGILEDVRFGFRVMLDAQTRPRATPAMMAALPLLTLTNHESRRWLGQHRADIILPNSAADQVQYMRNTTKWFNATKKDIGRTLEAFESLVIANRRRFTGNARFKWAQRFETDLGVHTYRGNPYLTTHGVAYAITADPSQGLEAMTVPMNRVGESIGQLAVGLLQVNDLPSRASFLSQLTSTELGDRDLRSERYYAQSSVFDMRTSAYFHAMWAQLEFSSMLASAPLAEDRPTALKYQIIILDHAVRALERLRGSVAHRSFRSLFDWPDILSSDNYRMLRNSLVHFTPHHTTLEKAIDMEAPLFGLLEHNLGMDYDETRSLVASSTCQLHAEMSKALGRS